MIRHATAFILLSLLVSGCGSGHTPVPPPEPPELLRKVRVIDADTVDIDGTRHRLHGIDAPESDQTCRAWGHTWDCGEAATDALMRHVDGISCRGGSTDRYGRVISVCSSGGQDLNAWLVRNGWALAEYSDDYRDEEAQARAERRGIHRGAFVRPADRRQGQRLKGDDTLAWVAIGPVDVPNLAENILWGDAEPIDGMLLRSSVFGFTDAGSAVSFGDWRATNPVDGDATWHGDMIAKNATGSRASGTARLTVDLQQLGVDLMLSSPDAAFRWSDVPLHNGAFDAGDGSMQGRFYGPRQDEAGGVFARDGWTGVFGVSSEETLSP